MSKKVTIELRPYDALSILSFLREFVNDDNKFDNRFAAIHETVLAYEKEIHNKVKPSMLEDAVLECRVNDLAGRHPKK